MKFSHVEKKFKLTPRESEVAQHVGHGEFPKQIADAMKISARTVEGYLQNLRRKTKTRSTYELIVVFYPYVKARA